MGAGIPSIAAGACTHCSLSAGSGRTLNIVNSYKFIEIGQ